jgi:Integrase core domain
MGSVGDCYDNAVCETFHASLKKERIYRRSWPTRAEARAAVFEYIEGWNNPRRRHSTLGYLSPAESERHHAELTISRLSAVGVTTTGNGPAPSEIALDVPTTSLRPRRTVLKGRTELAGLSAR